MSRVPHPRAAWQIIMSLEDPIRFVPEQNLEKEVSIKMV
jgi:hypothetical protein